MTCLVSQAPTVAHMHLTFVMLCWAQQYISCCVLLVYHKYLCFGMVKAWADGMGTSFVAYTSIKKSAQMDRTSLLVLVFGTQHRRNLLKLCLLLDDTFADCDTLYATCARC